VCTTDGYFEDIIHFLTTRTAPEGYTIQQKKELVACTTDFSVITAHLYKMGCDEILRWYVRKFEIRNILVDAHGGTIGGHYTGRAMHRRSYMHGCGGQPSIRTQKHISRRMMYVRGLAGHHRGMRCL